MGDLLYTLIALETYCRKDFLRSVLKSLLVGCTCAERPPRTREPVGGTAVAGHATLWPARIPSYSATAPKSNVHRSFYVAVLFLWGENRPYKSFERESLCIEDDVLPREMSTKPNPQSLGAPLRLRCPPPAGAPPPSPSPARPCTPPAPQKSPHEHLSKRQADAPSRSITGGPRAR